MTNIVSQRFVAFSRKPWLRRSAISLISLVLLYGLFGFFILPRIVQSQAEKFVADKFHRTLAIDNVAINPFTLLATVRGLKLMEAQENAVFVSFDALTVKVSWQSLLHLAPVVQEVLLTKPSVHLIRRDAHHYNFDDLLEASANPPSQPHPQQPARFAVYNIQVEGGRIDFDDKPVGAANVVSDIKLGVPFVSSLPSQLEIFVEPLLRANVNGALLQLGARRVPSLIPKRQRWT